ncbi:MAG: dihydrodipicolinate synthase family protein [Deltaproteobacteria bacterium]|nr:dihydrodipicolinate synthase family protein [Deltaproteobacteria bacterium]
MSSASVPFASLFVALPTFFDEQGKVDSAGLELLVGYLRQHGVGGVALLTEAAEDPFLLPDERRALIERVAAKLQGQSNLLVSVSAPGTREAMDLARFAEGKGATGILVSPLAVPGLGYRELYRHVDRVARSVALPVYITVRPQNAVDLLAPEEQATLAKHPGLAGVFLPQSPPAQVKVWARRFKGNKAASVLSGCALTFAGAARSGATAVVCGLSVLAVEASQKVLEGVKRGDVDAVRKIQRIAEPAVSFLGPPRSPEEQQGVEKLAAKLAQRPLTRSESEAWVPFGLIKAGLELQGHKKISALVRPPSEQPSPERLQKLQQVLRGSELLS